jgi:transposase
MAWKSGQSYSTDLRSWVLAAIDGGSRAKAVAQPFQVSVSYIYKALARREATGETEARPQRNRQTLKLNQHHDAIAAEVTRRPDVTLEELRAWLLATHGVTASLGLMHRTLARLGLTLKNVWPAPSASGFRSVLGSLPQRIRPWSMPPAQVEIRAARSS